MEKQTKPVAKKFAIQYPLRDYTFPKEILIDKARFDADYMHVALTDGRVISIPLKWLPTLYHAKPKERKKYQINASKRMIVWDPSVCEINEELCIENYMGAIQPAVSEKKAPRKKK